MTTGELQNAIEAVKVRYPEDTSVWPPGFSMPPNALLRRGLILKVNNLSQARRWGDLGPMAYTVLMTVRSYQGGDCPPRPTQQALAQLLGTSVRTIQRCIATLHEAGLLWWKTGRQGKANEYDVDFGPCKNSEKEYVQRPRWKPKKK